MATTSKAPRTAAADPTANLKKATPMANGNTAPTPAKHKKHKAEPHPSRQKLIRDSFTIPKSEVATLDALKLRAATLGRPAKKSEILRAGIAALHAMSDKALLTALARVPSLKTGRPPAPGRSEEDLDH